MGYSYVKHVGGTIENYWPDDTDDKIYLLSDSSNSLGNVIDLAKEKWPGITFAEIAIESENIHTNCIGYDLHDPGDYTQFIILRRICK